MDVFRWTNELSVGVSAMDRQHRELVDLINSLNDAMRAGRGAEACADVLTALRRYAVIHFGAEERLLRKHGYAALPTQETEHKAFVDRLAEIKSDLEQGKVLISMKIMTFLREWLVNHIQGLDKSYGPFLNRRGVS